MKRLTVLFDHHCQFCVRCAAWLMAQPSHVEIRMLPMRAAQVDGSLAPLLERLGSEEVIAVGDDGAVYRGDSAWIICLWALKEYRIWAHRLASPAMRPLARRFYSHVSRHRHGISRMLKSSMSDRAIVDALASEPAPACPLGQRSDVPADRWQAVDPARPTATAER